MFEAVFGRSTATGDAEPIAGPVTGAAHAGERVDLGRVLTGLRHLPAGEPARVFTELAGVCVPALCDECLIEIVEQGGHRYRIRRPDPGQSAHWAATNGAAAAEATGAAVGAAAWSGNGAAVTVSGGSVLARFGNPQGGGPGYTGEMMCIWRRGHGPRVGDAALVGVLLDPATVLVHRERSTAGVADHGGAGQVRLALDGT